MLPDGRRAAASDIAALIRSGAIAGDPDGCRANTETVGWLKRARLDAVALAAQHRVTSVVEGIVVNRGESPLGRLATGSAEGPAFLSPHHVEAGERVRRLVERAQLQPRLTMSYSASPTHGTRGAANEISDFAADARKALDQIHRVLPRDCAGVVIDVCGLLKGLQDVERERRWPRRSAKLVLRIGLDQLAQHFGIGPFAVGVASGRPRRWLAEGARPHRFE
ncbi:MAG TPA: DUF6456 domain-containing protein [Devosia sp.]|nr:DUF6456 domain-containing protein [Devosia sp.]